MSKRHRSLAAMAIGRPGMRHYPALIRKDHNSDFGLEFPDFPGCVTAGKTVDELLANAVEALALHVEGLRDDDQTIPEPTPLEAVIASATARETTAVLVELPPLKGRTIRFNVTMDEHLLAAIDAAAAAVGTTRSGYLAAMSRADLEWRNAENPRRHTTEKPKSGKRALKV